jgi:hypothetical protein
MYFYGAQTVVLCMGISPEVFWKSLHNDTYCSISFTLSVVGCQPLLMGTEVTASSYYNQGYKDHPYPFREGLRLVYFRGE